MSVVISGTTGVTTPAETVTTITSPSATALTIQSAGTTAMTVGTNQNIGIGGAVSSDTTYKWLTLTGPTTSGGGLIQLNNSDASTGVNMFCTNLAGYMGTSTAHPLCFRVTSSEVARFDTSGHLLVGTTTSIVNSYNGNYGVDIGTYNGDQGAIGIGATTTGSIDAIQFINPNGRVGQITMLGSATLYTSNSDYRLKEDVAPIATGLQTISELKPVVYKWKSDGSNGEGFIAHELQAVIPHAVTGEKDAVNENGSIKSQGVDYSKIVVHLVAAVQELTARIAALEAK